MSDFFEHRSDRNVATAVTFLFIGLGIGALSALLLAPQSGKQLRRDIRKRYDDAREVLEDWGDQAGDLINRGTEWANAAKDKVTPLAEKLRVK